MDWSAVGRFRIIGHETIEIARVAGASDALRHFPAGPVLAMVLALRGMLVLHASAVSLRRQGAVFLGTTWAVNSHHGRRLRGGLPAASRRTMFWPSISMRPAGP